MSVEERLDRIERKLDEVLELLRRLLEPLTPEELDSLDWKPYPEGEGEWIFVDEAPPKLLEALREKGSVVIGGYRYALREGRSKRFISRRRADQPQRQPP